MSRVWDEPIRDRSNVINLRQRVNHRPSQQAMYDQTKAPADRCVVITMAEGVRIATILQSAIPHLPSPKAAKEAIAILTGKRP